jgi:hypothetical protein
MVWQDVMQNGVTCVVVVVVGIKFGNLNSFAKGGDCYDLKRFTSGVFLVCSFL